MAYSLRMPDGYVVENIPDNISQDQVFAKYHRNQSGMYAPLGGKVERTTPPGPVSAPANVEGVRSIQLTSEAAPPNPPDAGMWPQFKAEVTRGLENYQAAQIGAMTQARGANLAKEIQKFQGDPGNFEALRSIQKRQAEQTTDLAAQTAHTQKAADIPQSDVMRKTMSAETWKDALSSFGQDPVRFITESLGSSLVPMAETIRQAALYGAAAGKPGLVLGTAQGSFETDYSSQLLSAMAERGVDIRDKKSLEKAFSDPQLIADIRKEAGLHAGPVAMLDALSAHLATKVMSNAANPLRRELTNVGAQAVAQATLGGAGEAAGQALSTGKIKPGEVLAEAAGEFASVPVDIATASIAGVRDKGGPAPSDVMAQINPDQAKSLGIKPNLPSEELFGDAVANTPGAKLTPDGLLLDVTRYQKPEQEGAQAIRTGVFYLPTGSQQEKYYRGKAGYGGSERFQGETLLQRPMFVKGATGGKAPEAAYNAILGDKKAYEAMRSDVLKTVFAKGPERVDKVAAVLDKYGADPGMASEIVRNSKEGNTLPYAIQENIVAHTVRKAGYDSVLGWSKGKSGPFISEVFDVRETTYPARGMDSIIHPAFESPLASRTTPNPGIDVPTVQKTIAPIIKAWPTAQVESVQDYSQLPPRLAKYVVDSNAQHDAAGLFDNVTGKIYLLANNIKDPEHAVRTVLHEGIGHYGLRAVLGNGIKKELQAVAFTKGLSGLQDIVNTYQLDWKNPNHQLVAAEEYIARLAESNVQSNLLDQVIAAVKRFIRTINPNLKYTDKEIRALIASSRKAVEKGKRPPSRPGAEMSLPTPPTLTDAVDFKQAGTDLEPFLIRVSTEQDYQNAIANVVAQNSQEFMNARRGKMTWKEIEQGAKQVGIEAVMDKKTGQAMSPEEWEAGRAMLKQATGELLALKDKALSGNKPDLVNFQVALDNYKELSKRVVGARAEWGRLGSIMRKAAMDIDMADRILEQIGGAQTVEGKAKALDSIQKHGAPPHKVAKAAIELSTPTVFDKIYEIWVNGILSGIKTHSVNVTSNTLYNMMVTAEQGMAATLGKLHSGDKVYFREIAPRIHGLKAGALEAMALSSQVWHENPTDPFVQFVMSTNKLEQEQFQAIKGKTGKLVRIPGRALQVEDMFFKTIAFRQVVKALSMRQAISEGAENVSVRASEIEDSVLSQVHMGDIRDDMAGGIAKKALADAEYMTFTNPLGERGQKLTRGLRAVPGLRYVVPFVRTPTNIMKATLQRSPLALAMPTFYEAMKEGGPARDLALARMLVGTGTMVVLAGLTMSGLITGGGPEDPRKRALWMRNNKPYSVKIPGTDTYVSYNRMDPVGSLIGISADFTNVAAAGAQGAEDVPWMATAAVMNNFVNKTWAKGMSDMVMAMYDPQRYGERWFTNFTGSFLPYSSALRQTAGVIDPYMRQADGTLEKMRAGVPFLSKDNLPVLDLFGRPISVQPPVDLLTRAILLPLPLYIGMDPHDPVTKEMLDIDLAMGRPKDTINGHKLTPDQYNEYIELAGQPAYTQLKGMVTVPGWTQQNPDLREKLIREVILSNRETARVKMMSKYQSLRIKAAQ